MLNPGRIFKKYLPKSLLGRGLMILVLPMVLLQVVVALVFIKRHYDGVTAQMASAVARELAYTIQEIDIAPDNGAARRVLTRMNAVLGIEMHLRADLATPQAEVIRQPFDVTGGVIAETLNDELRRTLSIDLKSQPKQVKIAVHTKNGTLLAMIPRRLMNAANPHLLLVWMVVTSIFLTAIATFFLHNQIRPIRHLALAASAFGRGRMIAFRPRGAEEVRRAGQAFLDMRNRIERHVEQRTRMLSGVSHDLRTPLTRIKLALALDEGSPENEEIARDVNEMEQMLEGFLAFARGEGDGAAERISALELAEEITAEARRKGAEIDLHTETLTDADDMIEVRRASLKRAITNIIDNAISYGDNIIFTLRLGKTFAEFVVEDDGPGIPTEKRTDALLPFTRLDDARGQNLASGVGLGLSIALDIANSHGGALNLDQSARLGGLSARLIVPR